MMKDEVRIKGLRLRCKIGVPKEERTDFQEIEMDLTLIPTSGFPEKDEIAGTVDYAEVAQRVVELAGEGECLLIETLAQGVAEMILEDFAVERVRLELRKFILPETDWVGVALERGR